MEITAYLHRDVPLTDLPQYFEVERFSENRHQSDRFANVMWVDMPDFDSAETENRDQVLQWLPHIDLLIYVVTPERYKDAEGWRMMLENGYRHAWLFAMNQWDRAEPVQYDDFVRLLEQAGFNKPQVFRTVCVGTHDKDEFPRMLDLIESLATHNVIQHLQERGWMQRLISIRSGLEKDLATLSHTGTIGMTASFNKRWQQLEATATAHLDAPFKAHGALFAPDKTGNVFKVLKSFSPTASKTDVANSIASRNRSDELWDDWLSVRLQDSINEFQLAEVEHGVLPTALSSLYKVENKKLTDTMTRHFDESVASAIETPGPLWQRFILKAASWLKIFLPVVALLWVAWRVLNGFITGAEDRSAYVGIDFMVNGILLAVLGWLIPMILEKALTPSLPDAVYRSLHKGLKNALAEVKQDAMANIESLEGDRDRHLSTCLKLKSEVSNLVAASEKPTDAALQNILLSAPSS